MLRSYSLCKILRNCAPSRNVCLANRLWGKLDFEDSEDIQKTTLNFTTGADSLQITGCFKDGFQFGNRTVLGSIALLPNTLLKWKPKKVEEITEQSLRLFTIVHPKLELVIIGTGNVVQQINPDTVTAMRKHGILLEVQDTKNACGTFNLLKGERPGQVGAALLPMLMEPKLYLPNADKRKRSKASIVT